MELQKILKSPWELIDPSKMEDIEKELSIEIGEEHPLYNVNCQPIAQRIDNDDVLFEINPHLCDYAIVHLTWSGKKETSPDWPTVELFTDIDDLNNERLIPDHEAYID